MVARTKRNKPTKSLPKLIPAALGIKASNSLLTTASAATSASTGAEQIRTGFSQVIDVGVAIAEPIIWMYAVVACVQIATNVDRNTGWNKLKNVGYAYILMCMLPAIFSFWRWISKILQSSMQFAQ